MPGMPSNMPATAASDLETQGILKNGNTYGAADANKAVDSPSKEVPLLLGWFSVAPQTLVIALSTFYCAIFAIFRLADIGYLATVDAAFPAGLNHLYPSEWERLQAVSYTRQVVLCDLLHRTTMFTFVALFVYFGVFAKVENGLSSFIAAVLTRLGSCWNRFKFEICCEWMRNSAAFVVDKCTGAASCICSPCLRCGGSLANRLGFKHTFLELLHGGIYITLFAAAAMIVSVPFMYWMRAIDVNTGFTNPLNFSWSMFHSGVISSIIKLFIVGIPTKMAFLFLLQCRFGWLVMWIATITAILIAQANMSTLAPAMLGFTNAFPNHKFGVGRGFPLVETGNAQTPWVSLNRVYFKQDLDPASVIFATKDNNKGQLVLMGNGKPAGDSQPWGVSLVTSAGLAAMPYAQTLMAIPGAADMGVSSWAVGGKTKPGARIAMREGSDLRGKITQFATERHMTIGEIYIVDGSSNDVRANAMVAGAGNGSVMGLYDTLFLGEVAGGDDEAEELEDTGHGALTEMAEGKPVIELVSEAVQGVEDSNEDRRKPLHSAPTQAMTDDEVVAVLAHELAHPALRHLERGALMQGVSSFFTFAFLGWMAHSPLVAAGLGLPAALVWVGACVYDHGVGPPLEAVLKFFSDYSIRKGEYEADAYVAHLSEHYGKALQGTLAKLTINSNQDPDVPLFYEVLHADHPTFSRRWANIERVLVEKYGSPDSGVDVTLTQPPL